MSVSRSAWRFETNLCWSSVILIIKSRNTHAKTHMQYTNVYTELGSSRLRGPPGRLPPLPPPSGAGRRWCLHARDVARTSTRTTGDMISRRGTGSAGCSRGCTCLRASPGGWPRGPCSCRSCPAPCSWATYHTTASPRRRRPPAARSPAAGTEPPPLPRPASSPSPYLRCVVLARAVFFWGMEWSANAVQVL